MKAEATQTELTKWEQFRRKMPRNTDLLLFCLPGIIVTIIFHYIPLYGIQIAFQDYSPKGSPWVGLEHFRRFFQSSYSLIVIKNTFILSFYSLVASFPIPIILALMLNSFRYKHYKKAIQSVTYAPNFISVVVMASMVLIFLAPQTGFVNLIIQQLGFEPIHFMADASYWRHIYVWSGVWQTMGWSSVIYFAALSGVSPEFHEAAVVDGASKFQRILHIDLPSLIPVAAILLVLSFGSIFSIGFEKAFALQNDTNLAVSEIISTYVYRIGILNRDISFSAAIGLFNSAVNAVLLLSANFIVGKLAHQRLF